MEIPLQKYLEEHGELMDFFESFPYEEGNDREIVIVGCAYIESVVKWSLSEYLVQDEPELSALLDESKGTLPGLVQRARLLYLLGLLPKVIFHDLKIVAKIRNHFAHNVNAGFADDKVVSLCSNLKWHIEAMMTHPPVDATTRDVYQVGVNQLVCYLNGLPGIARYKRSERDN